MKVPISHDVLTWARKKRGLSEEEAAKAIRLPVTDLQGFESGAALPSLGLLERIAKKYQVPLALLLMPAPLIEGDRRPKDFRTHGGKEPVFDRKLLVAIDALNSQIDLLEELRAAYPEMVPDANINHYPQKEDPVSVASKERKEAPTLETQVAWPTPAQAFRYWRAFIESKGIFVYVMNVGPNNQCRGFTIWDDRGIPAIIINGDEAEGPARTFTLLHEYAHLLLREPGISDHNRANPIERWCNVFAAFFLMPPDAFVEVAKKIDPSGSWIDARLGDLANYFNVSMSAVALHLEELGLVKPGFYDAKMQHWAKRTPSKPFAQLSYAEKQVNRLGVRHVAVVLEALDRGRINQVDAIEMTDVYPEHYPELRTEVKERQATYGGVR